MAQQVILSGVGTATLRDSLSQTLMAGRPRAVGVASAFVSTEGVRQLIGILQRSGVTECRLIAGIDNAITHPEALFAAREHGWNIRLGKSLKGIFHPKLVVAGQQFSRNGNLKNLCSVYVGSSNLTNGGLSANVECGLIADADGCLVSAADIFATLWKASNPATDSELRHYAARFAECARHRAVSELANLGVNDSLKVASKATDLHAQEILPSPAIGADFAIAAWAGLQSFTGEYRFQVEFPKDAGKVIYQLISRFAHEDGRIDVYCPDDQATRLMQYKYYPDNCMFRLNVQNDVTGVEWARKHKDGIVIVEQGPQGGAPLRLRILRPGVVASEIVGRSAALGTWGRTTTRAYGWY